MIWKFLGSVAGELASMMDVCRYRVRKFQVGWWLSSSNLERVSM